MTHFELMEQSGQTNIFEFLPTKSTSKRNKGFFEGDKVRIRFYTDEVEYIQSCHPQLMGVGEVIGKQHDFYVIKIGEVELHVEGEKLTLV